MRSSAVISEFNPFHNGHAYLLAHMRQRVGADGCVVCLMSGRTVQRGTPAVADPYLRARMALAGGADLVLELPFPWSSGSAAHFAAAGVSVLSCLGIDTLTFGSECGDEALLSVAASATVHPDFGTRYAALCSEGMGSTAAYLRALSTLMERMGVPCPEGFPGANDLLGIAYLAAIRAQGSPMRPCVIKREGHGYHDTVLHAGEYPSATALRVLIREAACDPDCLGVMLEGTMPPRAQELLLEAIRADAAPVDGDRLLPLYHACFRLADADRLSGLAELSGGLAGHICRTARGTATPEAFTEALRTKQYTDAKLRRAMLFGLTGVTEHDLRSEPAYTTLLAANGRGCRFLAEWKRSPLADGNLAVVTKPADAPEGRQRVLCVQIDALYTLCLPIPQESGALWRRTPWIEK